MPEARVTERTFYAPLLRVIAEKGGSGVQEVSYNSDPDIEFKLIDRRWLLSVKIGESVGMMKGAFLQYLRHKQESGIENGLLLILPESVRRVRAEEQAVLRTVLDVPVSVLVDAGDVKEEYRDRAFPAVLDLIRDEIRALLERRTPRYFPLALVVDLLKAQVTEVMGAVRFQETQILKIVTDRKLLTDLAHLFSQRNRGRYSIPRRLLRSESDSVSSPLQLGASRYRSRTSENGSIATS